MKTRKELNELPADAYLNPENFRTPHWPNRPLHALEQYNTGLEYGKKFDIHIGYEGAWGGVNGSVLGSHTTLTTYEVIVYHSDTDELLRGLLDSGARITVYRRDGSTKV